VRGTYSLARKDKQAQQDPNGADDGCCESYNANQEEGRECSLHKGVAGFDADTKRCEEAVHDGQLVNNSKKRQTCRCQQPKIASELLTPSSASAAAAEAHWCVQLGAEQPFGDNLSSPR
jgi:hypothetical protein